MTRNSLLEELEASVDRGLADIEAGRLYDADEVFAELDAELAEMMKRTNSTESGKIENP